MLAVLTFALAYNAIYAGAYCALLAKGWPSNDSLWVGLVWPLAALVFVSRKLFLAIVD
jgi:hypothetical protein